VAIDWLALWERVGLPSLILVVLTVAAYRGVALGLWPFFTGNVWPELHKLIVHWQETTVRQEAQLKALYEVLLKVTTDYTTTNLTMQTSIERLERSFEKALGELVTMFQQYTSAVNELADLARRKPPFTDWDGDERRKKR
jgi:hypothetical protein